MSFFLKFLIWGACLALGGMALKRSATLPQINKKIILFVLVLAYAGLYAWVNITRCLSFNAYAFDLTVYLQALGNYALYSPLAGRGLLTQHFSPILLIFVPLLRAWPSPMLLFIIQAAAVAGAGIPFYFLAKRLGAGDWAALLFVFIYLNYQYTRQMAAGDFHVENLMPLALFTLFYLLLGSPDWKFWLLLLVSLTIKEDLGFYLFAWAVAVAVFKPEFQTEALLAALLSFVGGVLALWFLLPANHGVYPYFSYWSQYGKGIFGILSGAAQHPFSALGVLVKPVFLHMLAGMVLLPLATFWGLALLPVLWVQLASTAPLQAALGYYYSAPVLPFLFSALAAGWVRIRDRFISTGENQAMVLWAIGAFLLVFNFYWIPPYAVSNEQRAAGAVLQQLPLRGTVLAQADAAPQIPGQNRVQVLGKDSFAHLPEWVVFYTLGHTWPFSGAEYLQALNQLRQDARYSIWKEENGLVIFGKKPGTKAITTAQPPAGISPAPMLAVAAPQSADVKSEKTKGNDHRKAQKKKKKNK